MGEFSFEHLWVLGRDKDRDRSREKERGKDRSLDREREREREKERDRERDREKERDRNRGLSQGRGDPTVGGGVGSAASRKPPSLFFRDVFEAEWNPQLLSRGLV